MGLSVRWATCNLNADNPEDFGSHYAWGEITPKNFYSWENYAYYLGSATTCINIGDKISGTQFDAAYMNMGGTWRMPTQAEQIELIVNCYWKWIYKNKVRGMEAKSKKNGNTLFFPIGYYNFTTLWSGSLRISSKSYAYALYMGGSFQYSEDIKSGSTERYQGWSIRPVTK